MGVFTSSVHKAFKGTSSLRTTIPSEAAAALGLEAGSELIWTTEPGSIMVSVRKAAVMPSPLSTLARSSYKRTKT